MMKLIALIIVVLLSTINLKAQDLSPTVISTAGKDLVSGEYRLSFTIGEIAVTTLKSSNNILTQGFQQPPNLYLSDIKNNSAIDVSINVYPNPTQDIVNVSITDISPNATYSIYVFNNFGQLMTVPYENIQHSEGTNFTIDLTNFARGNYFIRVINTTSSENISDFKVLKIN